MSVKRALLVAATLVWVSLSALGAVLDATGFVCSGDDWGAECWLSDPRLTDRATWWFSNVPPGAPLPLVLEGLANDICETCQVGRDVLIRLYYQSPGDRYWQRAEFWLRNVAPGTADCLIAYPVRGEARIFPTGSELVVIAQRVLYCDPHVGFSRGSLRLGATPVIAVPVPQPQLPAPPPLPTPPPPVLPPPPVVEPCNVGPEFACAPAELPADCLPEGVDLATVERQPLPETYGPGPDVIILQAGHYTGSLGDGDFQDWYRIRAVYGDAFVIWLDPGNLVVDLFLIHDPCGDVLAQCLAVTSATTMLVPCYAGVDCLNLDDCFLDGECHFYIRIAWRGGSGPYRLSILRGVPEEF